MPVSGEQVLAIADRYDVALNGAEDKVIRKVQDALETAYLQMERELVRAYDANAKNLSLFPQQRALLIQQEIAEQLNRLDGDAQSLYAADFERMIRQSYGSGRDMAAELALAIADERLQSFAAVPLSAVRFAAENATSRLKNHTKKLRDQIATNISAGIALGSSSRKVAEQLRGELGLTKTRAEMIARTETLAAHNEAAKDAYQRNGIELVIWLGTSDERMCRFCAARNGNVYRAAEVVIPVHVRDRCTLTPYKPEWERAGLVDVDFYRRHREQGLSELRDRGLSPDNRPAPFEKGNAPIALGAPGSLSGQIDKPKKKPSPPPKKLPKSGRPIAVMEGGKVTAEKLATFGRARLEELLSEAQLKNLGNYQKQTERLIKKKRRLAKDLNLAILTDETKEVDRLTKEVLATDGEFEAWRKASDKIFKRLRARLIDAGRDFESVGSIGVDKTAIQSEYGGEIEGALNEFLSITRGNGQRSLKFITHRKPRAFANEGGELNIGDNKSLKQFKETFFHEMGHHVEFERDDVRDALADWVRGRATGPEVSLKELTGLGYGDDEKAFPDEFYDPYVGKIYRDNSTEVLSMGIEKFASAEAMKEFFEQDPEHFELTMGVLGLDVPKQRKRSLLESLGGG